MARGKPGPVCKICKSDLRAQVDLALASGIGYRTIAERFEFTRDVVRRHALAHLSPAQRLALAANSRVIDPTELDALREREGRGLLAGLADQRARLRSIADLAAQTGDFKSATAAEGRITSIFELIGKLCGELVNRSEVRNFSLLVSPDYMRLRTTLIETLRPFPAAAQAVAAALYRMENETLATPASRPVVEATALPPLPPLPEPPSC